MKCVIRRSACDGNIFCDSLNIVIEICRIIGGKAAINRVKGERLKIKSGDDTKVCRSSLQGPEETWVGVLVGIDDSAVC